MTEVPGARPSFFLQRLHTFHERLTALTSLRPSEEADTLFKELVTFVLDWPPSESDMKELQDSGLCEDFHSITSEAEFRLEEYWARRLISGESRLSDFPYTANYKKLVQMEYHLLLGQGTKPRSIIFIGNGPLPLSSFLLAKELLAQYGDAVDWSILNVDRDTEANRLAREVSGKLCPDLRHRVSFLDCDAAQINADTIIASDMIYLAALVGLKAEDKESIVRSLIQHMKPGCRLLMRSASGLRCLLYPAVDEEAFGRAFRGQMSLELVCHPHCKIINSVMIARRL